jgi:hypothetical protein
MSGLKAENVKKCFYLLREFIDESQEENNKKGVAMLALNQLQKIAAGTDSAGPQCNDHPRADMTTTGG